MHTLPIRVGVDTSINSNTFTMALYHFILTLLNANFDVAVSVAYDVGVPRCAFQGKARQGSSCQDVRTLTNENGRYTMKLIHLVIHTNYVS